MTVLGLIRHGETSWNKAKRMQGRADIPLTPQSRHLLRQYRPPKALQQAVWYSSPLCRATETANCLGVSDVTLDQRLIETDWGQWQGKTIEELREELGNTFLEEEGKGFHFKPPNGESPADVMARVRPFLEWAGQHKGPVGAVTHKGVIRAILALAFDWDMTTKAPVKLHWHAAHMFSVDEAGAVQPLGLNAPLVGS